ncbi:DUF4831 family protein [Prolixibacter sp. SD074]|uniref:DUF4831 family protein n=1 Tax=Prolixibacter sp. SD074 TaxID=2652391 RepID=UPI00188FF151|nr:DUF4831 family protein [Prolixibacter sp. SD074]
MKSIYLTLLGLLFVAGQVMASPKDEKPVPFTGGVVYSLPETGIRVTVEAEQVKFVHGPYYQYAEKYLGIPNAPSADRESWKITNVRLSTYGEPDPTEIHTASGPFASALSLTEDGVLIGINSDVKSGKDSVASSVYTPDVEVPAEPWPDRSMHSFLNKVDTIRPEMFTSKTLQQKALETAHDITKIRKREFKSLAFGYDKALPDGEAYNTMVAQLDKLEKEYVGLFIGKSYKAKHTYVFNVVPDAKNGKSAIVFRFSTSKGVVPTTDLSGKPVMLEIDRNIGLEKSNGQIAGQQTATPGTSNSGLFYRIPGNAGVRLLDGTHILLESHLTLGQFGKVVPIPEGLLNGSYAIRLHPATGAIQRIKKIMEKNKEEQ